MNLKQLKAGNDRANANTVNNITTDAKANANNNALDNANATVNVTSSNANTKARC